MRILIDGEACPQSVQRICLNAARKYKIPIFIVEDFQRQSLDGAPVSEQDFNPMPGSRDYTLASLVEIGDIVVTFDHNLAAEVYPKVLVVLHPSGFIYNDSNMNTILYERYITRKSHSPSGKNGPRVQKRSTHEDRAFRQLLLDVVTPVHEKAPYIKFK